MLDGLDNASIEMEEAKVSLVNLPALIICRPYCTQLYLYILMHLFSLHMLKSRS